MKRLIAVMVVLGCSALSPQPDRTKYFLLRPLAVSERQPVGGFDRTIGIGPITIPDHLERGLVTRLDHDEIAISDTDRWAEPLRESLSRTLRQNLTAILGTERIVLYPWELSSPPDVAVTIEILQFERTASGMANLAARWTLERGPDRIPFLTEETRVSKPIQGTDTRAAVAALSSTLVALSKQIAGAIRRSAQYQ